jgi:hypothetical protein
MPSFLFLAVLGLVVVMCSCCLSVGYSKGWFGKKKIITGTSTGTGTKTYLSNGTVNGTGTGTYLGIGSGSGTAGTGTKTYLTTGTGTGTGPGTTDTATATATVTPPSVSGGVCVKDTALSWFNWGSQDDTWGGATCDKTGTTWAVKCPAGQTKNIVFTMTASNQGGEGAICTSDVNAFPTAQCIKNMPNIWDGYNTTSPGITCMGNSVTCPVGVTKNTLWNLTANGMGGEGALCKNDVSGGLCFNAAASKWDPAESVKGGATCDKSGSAWTVICPAGKTKRIISKWSNFGGGGEGALCL